MLPSLRPPPALALPVGITLPSLSQAANSIVRLPHKEFNALLTRELGNIIFQVEVGGQRLQINHPEISGAAKEYHTTGVLGKDATELHVTIDWQGEDLVYHGVRVAEAEVECGASPPFQHIQAQRMRALCLLRKAGARAFEVLLSQVMPKGLPLRPLDPVEAMEFEIEDKKYAVKVAVEQSMSTAQSLQLLGNITVVPRWNRP